MAGKYLNDFDRLFIRNLVNALRTAPVDPKSLSISVTIAVENAERLADELDREFGE